MKQQNKICNSLESQTFFCFSVEEIITLKHQESINNEELIYSTLDTNVDENEEIFILENDNCQQQRCFKSEAQKQASNCLFNLLLFLTLLLTNYN